MSTQRRVERRILSMFRSAPREFREYESAIIFLDRFFQCRDNPGALRSRVTNPSSHSLNFEEFAHGYRKSTRHR